jgi:glycosyltransferase involved in cell wall biosynthesis
MNPSTQEKARSIRVAMIGSRGLPVVYGGIERHVEELGARLAARGHRVTVFGRRPFSQSGEYRGMRVEVLPSIHTKHLETATSTLAATLRVLFEPFDVVHFHGVGPSLFAWMPPAARRATVATIHAQDYRQSKWGRVPRALLKLGERTAVERCHAAIAVSRLLASSLSSAYGRPVVYIPNGATVSEPPPFSEAARFGIQSGRYVLSVGRFIVERGFHVLLRAWKQVNADMRLVIAGEELFEGAYARELRELADDRVVFSGYVAGRLLDELYAHCAFYVLPSTLEGLPISLIEAMSFARPAVMSDIPENLEVAESTALLFRAHDARDLARAMRFMIAMDPSEREKRGRFGRERVQREYTWDRVAGQVEALYLELLKGRPQHP